jgi:hypothetical protein
MAGMSLFRADPNPDSWSCVPEVLSSPAAAAVKRLGLLLTFGVYLSALFAEPWDPWCKSE